MLMAFVSTRHESRYVVMQVILTLDFQKEFLSSQRHTERSDNYIWLWSTRHNH